MYIYMIFYDILWYFMIVCTDPIASVQRGFSGGQMTHRGVNPNEKRWEGWCSYSGFQVYIHILLCIILLLLLLFVLLCIIIVICGILYVFYVPCIYTSMLYAQYSSILGPSQKTSLADLRSWQSFGELKPKAHPSIYIIIYIYM